MEPEYFELPELHLLGLRIVGKPKELGKLTVKGWRELQGRLGDIPGVKDPSKQIGFLLPKEHVLALGRLATFISVEVEPDTPAPKGLRRHDLPARRYAAFTYRGAFTDPAFAAFYPGIFQAIGDGEIPYDAELGWIELYDDASHDWSDKSNKDNVLTVAFPLRAS